MERRRLRRHLGSRASQQLTCVRTIRHCTWIARALLPGGRVGFDAGLVAGRSYVFFCPRPSFEETGNLNIRGSGLQCAHAILARGELARLCGHDPRFAHRVWEASLEQDIERYLVQSERNSRENGWSYLKQVTHRLHNARQRPQQINSKGALERALELASAKPGKRGQNKKSPSGKPDSGV